MSEFFSPAPCLVILSESAVLKSPTQTDSSFLILSPLPDLGLFNLPFLVDLLDPLLGLSLLGFCRAPSALPRHSLGALSALSLGALQDLSRPSHDSSLQVPLLCVCTLGSPSSVMVSTNKFEIILECKICLMSIQ